MWPVGEYVSEVRSATGAGDFDATHAMTGVGSVFDAIGCGRGVETGPSAAGVIFGAGVEEFLTAGGAEIHAGSFSVGVLAGERQLGTFLAKDAVLLGSEFLFPLLFGFCDLLGHWRLSEELDGGVAVKDSREREYQRSGEFDLRRVAGVGRLRA